MPITLNETTPTNWDADAATNWTYTGASLALAGSDITQKEGTDCLQWKTAASPTTKLYCKSPVITGTFDLRNYEVGIWFLNPYEDVDGNIVFTSDAADQVCLRVWSGANWADYNQGHLRNADNSWPGGWMYLRASGGAGSEDTNSGTWTNTQAAAIDAIGPVVKPDGATNNNNDTGFGVDYAKYYDKIIVTGYKTGTTPWEPSDIYDQAITSAWGVVEKTENFYRFFAGLEFGNGTTAGAFKSENEYLYLNQSSSDHDYTVTIKSNHPVTLGKRNPQTEDTYAQNGVQFVAEKDALFQLGTPADCRPNLTVENGAQFDGYATLLRGFGTLNFGSGGTGQCEFIKCDLFDNSEIEIRSTGTDWTDVRMHFPDGDESSIGTVYSIPTLLKINVFQCTDGLTFRVTTDVEEYVVGDSTNDLVILEGKTVTLIDSNFSPDKLARVAV